MKNFYLYTLEVVIGIFICSCTNQINPVDNKGLPTNQPTAQPSIYPNVSLSPSPTPVDLISENFIDKDFIGDLQSQFCQTPSCQSPSCQNPNVITGNIYSNNSDRYELYDLNQYFEALKYEVPLENVEITYNNKTLKSNLNGVFNLPKTDLKEDTKFKFSKQGYLSAEFYIYGQCLFHIGLSPLYENELLAKDVKITEKNGVSASFKELPSEFFKAINNNLGYIIIDSLEKAKKINLGEYNYGDSIIENIDYNKEMQIIIGNGSIFGYSPKIVDTVMESDNNLILSSHKSLFKTLIPQQAQASRDYFAIIIQSIIVPKSDKEIILNLDKDVKIKLLK